MREIRGYMITSEKLSTSSTLLFAEKWGRKYVLKQYLSYRFPTEEGEPCPEMLRASEQRAERFLAHLKSTTEALKKHCREDGLFNIPLEIFRQGRMIYKVSRYVESCGIPIEELHNSLTPEQMNDMLKTVLLQMDMMERASFVHGDIKPENVIVSRRKNLYVASLIDFDTGFLVGGEMPEGVDYTPEYAAPEMILLHEGMDEDGNGYAVACPADTFAMGCVFAAMITGHTLTLTDSCAESVYPGFALLSGCPVSVGEMHPLWRTMLRRMLAPAAKARIHPRQVLDTVNAAINMDVYREMEAPFAQLHGLKAEETQPSMCTAGMCVMRQSSRKRMLLRHMEECFQLPWRPKWMSKGYAGIQREQKKRLVKLQERERALGGLFKADGAVAPFTVMQRGRCVFVETKLPPGKLLPIETLHLPAEEADALMSGLISEIGVFHQKGLIHGRMTGNSLFAVESGDKRFSLVLTDGWRFGPADALSCDAALDVDPSIMAPEVCMWLAASDDDTAEIAKEMIGPASDIFSLGMIYHILLTGRLPGFEVEGCVIAAQVPRSELFEIDPSIAADRAAVIRRMIEMEPSQRPASCDEVMQLIGEISTERAREAEIGENEARSEEERRKDVRQEEQQTLTRQPNVRSQGHVPGSGTIVALPDDMMDFDFPGGDWNGKNDAPEEMPEQGAIFDAFADDALFGDEVECPIPPMEEGGDETEEIGEWFPLGDGRELPDETIEPGTQQNEEEIEIAEFTRVWDVRADEIVRPGFLQTPIRALSGEMGLLRAMIAGEDDLQRHGGQFRALQSAWNAVAEEKGLLPVVELFRHEGTLYASSPYPEELGHIVVGAAERNAEKAAEWAGHLIAQMQCFADNGLIFGLVAWDDLLFTDNDGMISVRIHAFNHVLRRGNAQDAALWAQRMRTNCDPAMRGSGTTNQPINYLAPEACRMIWSGGDDELTERAGVYSLGVILCVLLTGGLPQDKRSDEPMPFAWQWLLARMLAQDPQERIATFAEAAGELARIKEGGQDTHSVTLKLDGEPMVDQTVRLYAEYGEVSQLIDEAQTDEKGKAVFRGYMPCGVVYRVQCGEVNRRCRWKLR